ncbi:MAG: hypothetical protein Fur0010_03480 [Bdellovibrio sp.]
MSKKKFDNAIKFLRSLFEEDQDAIELIQKLEEKAKSIRFAPSSTDSSAGGHYPVPKEILSNDLAIAIFSDGGCRGNPGVGAWASMAQNAAGDILFETSGFDANTTNNRMELEGAISGLRQLIDHQNGIENTGKIEVHLYTDSKYVVDGMTQWLPGWKERGWRKADNKVPENITYWQRLDEMTSFFWSVHFHWVKGHNGHPQNEHCDRLCNQAMDEARL